MCFVTHVSGHFKMRVLNTDIAQFFEIDNMKPGKFELIYILLFTCNIIISLFYYPYLIKNHGTKRNIMQLILYIIFRLTIAILIIYFFQRLRY